MKIPPDRQFACIAQAEADTTRQFSWKGCAHCVRALEHACAHVDAVNGVTGVQELSRMRTRTAADVKDVACVWRISLQQRRDVIRLERIVLVAVQKIVVTRVCSECAQVNTFRTAAATRCI